MGKVSELFDSSHTMSWIFPARWKNEKRKNFLFHFSFVQFHSVNRDLSSFGDISAFAFCMFADRRNIFESERDVLSQINFQR